MKSSRPQSQLPALTGLRFVAAFSVLVAHAVVWTGGEKFLPSIAPYITQGPALGMPLFFVLSGFVIHYNYGTLFAQRFDVAFVRFLGARFARLYPLYVLLLVLYSIDKNAQNINLSTWATYATLTQSWFLRYEGAIWLGHLLLPPAWSISVEWFLYLFYAVVAVSLLRNLTFAKAVATWSILFIFYYLAIYASYINFDSLRVWGDAAYYVSADPQNAFLGWLFNTGPFGRLLEFMLGAVVAQIYMLTERQIPTKREARWGSAALYGAIIVCVALYAGAVSIPFLKFGNHYAGMLAPWLSIVLFACIRYRSRLADALNRPVVVFLGDASYSIYLLHLFVVNWVVAGKGEMTPMRWGIVVSSAVAMTLILAAGLYLAYEVPCRRLLRRGTKIVADYVESRLGASVLQHRSWIVGAALVFGIVAANWPKPSSAIEILDATYGESCAGERPPPPAVNMFKSGNATLFVIQTCGRRTQCDFHIDVNRIGDPVNGCAKSFKAMYRCGAEARPIEISVPAEAHGKSIRFDCANSGGN